jgi:hypothetical protein
MQNEARQNREKFAALHTKSTKCGAILAFGCGVGRQNC